MYLQDPQDRAYAEEWGLMLQPVAYGPDDTPVVTAHAFAAFIAAWGGNDRNGTWGTVLVGTTLTGQRALIHVPNDCQPYGLSVNGALCEDMGDEFGDLDVDDTGVDVDVSEVDAGVDVWEAGEAGTYLLTGWDFVKVEGQA